MRLRIVILLIVLVASSWPLPRAAASAPLPFPSYPRPAGDNGWGIHWVPTLFAQPPDTVDRLVAEVASMGIMWVKIMQPDQAKVEHEYLIRQLVEVGIMPILRVYRPFNTPYQHLDALVRGGVPLGVHYYELYNEPNMAGDQGGWRPGEEIDPGRMARIWLQAAETVVAAGGLPSLPAPTPGGHYDDLAFLRAFLQHVVENGGTDVFEHSWVALHNYFLNHPLEYPGDLVNLRSVPLAAEEIRERGLSPAVAESINHARSISRLPRAQGGYYVGDTIHEDSNGFRKFEAYQAIVREELGFEMPIISTEGGAVPGTREDPRYPTVTDEDVADLTVGAYAYMIDQAPAYYFAFTPWLLANLAGDGRDPKWENAAWFKGYEGEPMPVVERVRQLASTSGPRIHSSGVQEGATPVPTPTSTPTVGHAPALGNSRVGQGDQGWFVVWRDLQPFNCMPVLLSATAPAVRSWRAPRDGRAWGVEIRDATGQRLASLGRVGPTQANLPPVCGYVLSPAPAAMPTPSLPPKDELEREWDERLDVLRISLQEADPTTGEGYWRLVSARLEDPLEGGGRHHIYLRLEDERGQPIAGTINVTWSDGSARLVADPEGSEHNQKADSYARFAANFPMYGALGGYTVSCEGPSDVIRGLGLPQKQHVNYLLVFQRTTAH